MKQFQAAWRGEEDFRSAVSGWKKHGAAGTTLIHLFSDGAEKEEIEAACRVIEEEMPEAEYAGASASGCIFEGRVSTEKLVVSCMMFEKPDSWARTRLFPLGGGDIDAFRMALRACLEEMRDVKAIEVITTIDTVPIRDVCEAIQAEVPESIPVWGGGAFGDNTFSAFVFRKGETSMPTSADGSPWAIR